MKKIGCFLVAVMLVASIPATAQQTAGDSELQLQGSLSLGIGSDGSDNGSVFLNYGRFFTDRQEAGALVFASFDSDGDFSGFGGPFYRYNLSTGKTVPYVGASAAIPFGDYSEGDILLTPEGGVRWFLERNLAFSLAANLPYDVNESEFHDQLQVLFGFSYLWGQ